jgi:ankyrin repeat protein
MRRYLFVAVATVWSMMAPANGQVEGQTGPVMTGTQALFEAMRQGEIGKVRIAVNNGANVNSRDADGNTLLMQAAVYSTAAEIEFLLAHGADVNAVNNTGHPALMRAMPELAKIKLLVEHGADINAAAAGTTPLLIAAGIRSAEDVVRYLVQKGADLKAINALGFDAVMTAAGERAIGNLKILLDAGAGAGGATEAKNRRVTRRAGAVFDQTTIDRLRKRAEGITPLMSAARADCEICVRLLLEHGADGKAKTDAGLTALHFAAFNGNLAMVKLLLEAGASSNVADDRGLTPLMMTANSKSKNPEVVRMLLDRGADRQSKDELGRSAADWARIGAHPEIVKMFPSPAALEVVRASAEPAFKDPNAAVAKSIALLEEAAPKFFPNGGCISCHNVSIPLMALTEARRRGYAVKAASTELLVKQTVAAFRPHRDNLLSGFCGIFGKPVNGPYALISLKGEGYAPDSLTDGIVRCLAVDQYPDGHLYHGVDTRPPLSAEGSIPDTALSAQAMKLYSVPALARDVEANVARARSYLLSAKPWFGDDYAYRLFGLFWTDAKDDQIQVAARELVAQQRPDGGWAQTPYMSSDAYETGLSLSALAAADPGSVDSVAYRRGVDYLMRTQMKDGSWHVRTRAFGFQPYFESGFPHGHDQWISMAATAWSAMALMPSAERAQVRTAR